jgi:bifunctional DNA-binding transcriptional regulator/antitoxin component of YhaV-PrlF toxin-antitoxin module
VPGRDSLLRTMEIVKLGKEGQVSIPRSVLRRLGLGRKTLLLVDTTAERSIILRPVAAPPFELYSDARNREFAREDRLTQSETRSLRRKRSTGS